MIWLSSNVNISQGRALPLSRDKRVSLVSRSLDELPAEEAGINRPGTGSNHGQGGTEDRQYHVNPGIARLRENDPNLEDSDYCARQWSPQADEQKCPGHRPDHVRNN